MAHNKRLQPVNAVEDNDGHWYVIPNGMIDEFFKLLKDDSTEDEFIKKFDDYRTGGDLNLIQLYANI